MKGIPLEKIKSFSRYSQATRIPDIKFIVSVLEVCPARMRLACSTRGFFRNFARIRNEINAASLFGSSDAL